MDYSLATFDVLLPVKNGLDYLSEAIDSILNQTFKDWRLLILDHGSTDGSYELAHKYAQRDSRIILHSLPEVQGLSGLLNAGLDLCDCRYVLRQDADDISMPIRMEVIAKAFESDPKLVLIGSLGDVIDAKGNKIGNLDMPTSENGILIRTPFRIPVVHPSVALRFESIRRLNARYGNDFIGVVPENKRLRVPGLAEDYFLFGQLALITKCRNLDQKLIKFRWHGSNISSKKYLEQTQIALDISRYLVDSLTSMHGTDTFDPAPFCNHAIKIFRYEDKQNFLSEFMKMKKILSKIIPDSKELRQELSFREVLADRSFLKFTSKYASHAFKYGIHNEEKNTVRSWLIRNIKKQHILTLTSNGLVATL